MRLRIGRSARPHGRPPTGRDDEVRAGHDDQPDRDAQRVVLDAPGLDAAQAARRRRRVSVPDAVDRAVDDVRVEPPQRRATRPPITMNSRWLRSSNHHLLSDAAVEEAGSAGGAA